MNSLPDIIGILASIFTSAASAPQLIKILRKKSVEDISLLMLIALITGLACWTWYGILRKDWIIVISNSLALLINAAIAVCFLIYRKPATTKS